MKTQTIYAPANWNQQLRKPTAAGLPKLGLSERAVLSEIEQRCRNNPRGLFIDSARGIAYSLEASVAVVGRAVKKLVKLGLVRLKKLSPFKSVFTCVLEARDTHSDKAISMNRFTNKRKNAAAAAASKSRDVQRKNASLRDLNKALDFAASERPTKPAQQAQQIQSLQKKSRKSVPAPKRESLPTPSKPRRKQEQQCPKVYRRPRPCVNSTTERVKPSKHTNGDSKNLRETEEQRVQASKPFSEKSSKTPERQKTYSSEKPNIYDESMKRRWEAKRRSQSRQRTQRLKDGDAYYTTSTPLTDVNVWAALGLQNTASDSQKSNTQAHRSSRTQRQNGGRPITTTSPKEKPSASSSGSPQWGENSRGKPATPRKSREMDGVNTKLRSSSETSSTDSRLGSSSTATPTGTTRRFDRSPGTGSSRWLIKPSQSERTIEHGDR